MLLQNLNIWKKDLLVFLCDTFSAEILIPEVQGDPAGELDFGDFGALIEDIRDFFTCGEVVDRAQVREDSQGFLCRFFAAFGFGLLDGYTIRQVLTCSTIWG